MKTRNMKTMTKVALALLATTGLGGCDLTVPDLNRPSVDSFESNPTRTGANSAAIGLIIGHRAGKATQNGYVAMLGILGRENYVMDTADPRYIGEMLAGTTLDPGSPAFGGNFWTGPYANIRNANLLLNSLDKIETFSAEERNALRGFALTIQALDFLTLITTRDTNGAPVDVNRPLTDGLAPIEGKDAVLEHIARLLDDARTSLAQGGTTFPFPLGSGFADFDNPERQMTVPNFIKFNRGVKARVDVYRRDWSGALEDLEDSFLQPEGGMDVGVYLAFGTGSGDTPNELNDPDIYVHPSVSAQAPRQPGGAIDARVQRKVKEAREPRTWQGVSSSQQFNHYPNATSPLPIIRNEELILLRAEAYIHQGAATYPNAIADLNRVRVRSGGLAPVDGLATEGALVDELLTQRRYSLLFEGGHRWIDLRRYDRLDDPQLKDLPTHTVHKSFPIPIGETDARQ